MTALNLMLSPDGLQIKEVCQIFHMGLKEARFSINRAVELMKDCMKFLSLSLRLEE